MQVRTNILALLCALGVVNEALRCEDQIVVQLRNPSFQEHAQKAMRLYVGVWGEEKSSRDGKRFLRELDALLSFDQAFDVEVETLDQAPETQEEITGLFKKGFEAALLIHYAGAGQPAEWRLYDTRPGFMISGRRTMVRGQARDLAISIAERVLKELTDQRPPFLAKVVFVERPLGSHHSCLWIMDFDGNNRKLLLESKRILVAPIWTPNQKRPFIMVSEFARTNVRFIGVDMQGHTFPFALNLKGTDATGKTCVLKAQEGTFAGISYGLDVSDVAFCASGDIWRYSYRPGGLFNRPVQTVEKVISKPGVACSYPNLLLGGDIIYGADGKILYYHAATKESTTLAGKGFCVSPAYSGEAQSVVYAKRVNRVMQLFVYSLDTKKTRQVTFDAGNKIDPRWSPCGRYVYFTRERGHESRIGRLSLVTQTYTLITPRDWCCSSPDCSGWFEVVI